MAVTARHDTAMQMSLAENVTVVLCLKFPADRWQVLVREGAPQFNVCYVLLSGQCCKNWAWLWCLDGR